jgi:hypothetical protein
MGNGKEPDRIEMALVPGCDLMMSGRVDNLHHLGVGAGRAAVGLG